MTYWQPIETAPWGEEVLLTKQGESLLEEMMSDLVNRLRLQAEDLHSLNPASETVKCLSLGADEIDRLRAENARMKAELKSIEGALDDPRANLTLTTAEIIRELKAQLATSPLPLTQG